jgi:hypothetical protein
MNTLLTIGFIGFAIGLALLLLSNLMYVRRTHDQDYLKRVWLAKRMLTDQEYLLNRAGFVIAYGMAALSALYLISL